uniref:Uncharacterized protein n=1 Tax=Nymphaea colorata TaxID=210225 RepID=A0A5K1AXQ6_9MAGN
MVMIRCRRRSRRRCVGRRQWQRRGDLLGRRTLVALGEEAEGVDLVHEVGHAGPPAEAEPHDQHPPDDEGVDDEHADPPAGEPRRPLHGVLSGRGRPEGEHVGEGWNDVDGEGDEEGADGGVDGAEEGEDDGQEPDGDDYWQPRHRPLADALRLMHSYQLLPYEIQRRAREPERYELLSSLPMSFNLIKNPKKDKATVILESSRRVTCKLVQLFYFYFKKINPSF